MDLRSPSHARKPLSQGRELKSTLVESPDPQFLKPLSQGRELKYRKRHSLSPWQLKPLSQGRELKFYNLTMKVNRLEMLKANIGLELVDGFDGLQKYFDQILTERSLQEFERMAGILGETVRNNAKYAHAIVNASFANATYSDRIWMY